MRAQDLKDLFAVHHEAQRLCCGGQWVKIDDAEPEIGKHYWVFREGHGAVGYTDEDGVWFSAIDGDTLDGVTHFAEIHPPTEEA